MATDNAPQQQPASNLSKALSLVLNVLQVVPEVGQGVALARSLVSDIQAIVSKTGGDIPPEQLVALESQTAALMEQISNDVQQL